MGEEHVMELIEHIITSCTPVAEAHALLGILGKAGTVPWKSMPPYLKVLRAWHQECGRRPVLSKDLRIPVSDASTLPTCVRDNAEFLVEKMCVGLQHVESCVMNSWMPVMNSEYAVMKWHASVMILGTSVMKVTHTDM